MQSIDKLGWIHIKDRKALFVRSADKDKFYLPGGKREGQETDEEALIREIQEELTVSLTPPSISYLTVFEAQAHGMPEGVKVKITCYTADYEGKISASSEIAEYTWFTSADIPQATKPGELCLNWLKERDLID